MQSVDIALFVTRGSAPEFGCCWTKSRVLIPTPACEVVSCIKIIAPNGVSADTTSSNTVSSLFKSGCVRQVS